MLLMHLSRHTKRIMADSSDKSEHATKSSGKPTQTPERKRFYKTEPIPRLSYTDPRADELISQEVGRRIVLLSIL